MWEERKNSPRHKRLNSKQWPWSKRWKVKKWILSQPLKVKKLCSSAMKSQPNTLFLSKDQSFTATRKSSKRYRYMNQSLLERWDLKKLQKAITSFFKRFNSAILRKNKSRMDRPFLLRNRCEQNTQTLTSRMLICAIRWLISCTKLSHRWRATKTSMHTKRLSYQYLKEQVKLDKAGSTRIPSSVQPRKAL